MKRAWLIVFLLLLMPMAMAADLYSMDSLVLNLDVNGSFELVPTKDSAKLQQASADLFLYPKEDLRQSIMQWKSLGMVKEDLVSFVWNDKKIEKKHFGYNALLQTNNRRVKVQEKISFPLGPEDISGFEQYLQPTQSIDSNNSKVIAKASELAEGEDDLFVVTFKLASWVEENVKYDLNTVTSTASQKASWVLENKQGVCDEMTSLFVAMARSLGIPARFVSGISYSNSEEIVNAVGSNWAGHGWAEIYFPNVGWVSFDVTFNQYGYIDVTHIKLRDSFDPIDPAVKYTWVADGVEFNPGNLKLDVKVGNEGTAIPEKIKLEQEILARETDFGSYNMIKGIVKNTADHYTATALNLAVPPEIEVVGRNRRNILLHPKEVRETYWIVKVPGNLDADYIYTYPVMAYSEKNISVQDSFNVQQGKNLYSKEDIEALTVQNEEKSYSRKVSLDCIYQKEIRLGENNRIDCSVKNIGNTNLQRVNICLDKACEYADLPINQEKEVTLTMTGDKAGWQKVFLSAQNELIEKKISLEYAVLDDPKLILISETPGSIGFGEELNLNLKLEKDSFSQPQQVSVTVKGPRFSNVWNIENMQGQQDLQLKMDSKAVSYSNSFVVT
ncbi:MAG: transglutaminase-like domain-containing protein, partial [Nanoarchaeota archaeon]